MTQREIKFRIWDGEAVKPVNLCWFEESGIAETSYLHVAYAIMQYIGLKDRNGTDIYESDIVEFHSYGSHIVGVVVWAGTSFIVRQQGSITNWPFTGPQVLCKVMGNIYEQGSV